MQSLAEFLGLDSPAPGREEPSAARLEDIADPKAFALAVLNSREFRQYIVSGLALGNLPGFTSILGRLMDVAGWPKASSRIEHTGKDGDPIETITEVRRVIVRAGAVADIDDDDERPVTTH